MTKHTLKTIFLSLFSVIAVACGDPGLEPLDVDPGVGGNGGDPGFGGEGGVGGEPIEEERIAPFDNEDFVQFALPNNSNPNQNMGISIECDVFGDEEVFARVELLNVDGNDTTRINGGPIDCNEGEFRVTVRNDQVQLARIHVQGVPQEQTLIEYTIVVAPFN